MEEQAPIMNANDSSAPDSACKDSKLSVTENVCLKLNDPHNTSGLNKDSSGDAEESCRAKSCPAPTSTRENGAASMVENDHRRCDREVDFANASAAGSISRFSSDNQRPATIATRTLKCQHHGCLRRPRYGLWDAPMSFCQAHKRAGMYTIRNGTFFMATRDGNASGRSPPEEAADMRGREGGDGAQNLPNTVRASGGMKHSIASPGKSGCTTRPSFSSSPRQKAIMGLQARPFKPSGHCGDISARIGAAEQRLRSERPQAGNDYQDQDVEGESYSGEKEHNEKIEEAQQGVGGRGKTAILSRKRDEMQEANPAVSRAPEATVSSPSLVWPLSGASLPQGAIPAMATIDVEAVNPTAAPPGVSHWGGLVGSTPSAEIKVLQEARELAKAEAAASSSGRRARTPSRKALEAAGKLQNEGVQWMTKEKKEEQARFKKEYKAQRMAAAAAGLKAGHVIEALAVPLVAAGADEGSSNEVEPFRRSWLKLTPTQMLQVIGQQPVAEATVENVRTRQSPTSVKKTVAFNKEGEDARWKEGDKSTKPPTAARLESPGAMKPLCVTANTESVKTLRLRDNATSGQQRGIAPDPKRAKHSTSANITAEVSRAKEGEVKMAASTEKRPALAIGHAIARPV